MKKRFTLILLLSGLILGMRAQTVLYESFTAPFNPVAAGWDVQNQSSSLGSNTSGWYQGAPARFNAITGNGADYFAADMDATSPAGATNTISCWLITPTLNLVNGAWIQFATKGAKLPTIKPDRLQVYYSLGTGNNVGSGPATATNSAGTFTNIIVDYNTGMTANGYPSLWWVFTASLTGISTPTVGRLAFRYYVPDGGAAGPNGNYIGLDEFRYSLPCNKPMHFGDQNTQTPPCAGSQIPLGFTNVTPAVPITSYTWFTGANTPTTTFISPNPGLTEIWSLGESTPGCVNLDISFFLAQATPTISYTLTPGTTICAASHLTVNASGGTSYTYALGSNSSSTLNPLALIAPTVATQVTTQFTLTGRNAANCRQSQVITLTVNPSPVVTASLSSNAVCINKTVTLSATGANSYTWAGALTSTLSQVSYSAGTTPGVRQFTVTGRSADGCLSQAVVRTLTVSACTGIDEMDHAGTAVIYPNPFRNELHLTSFTGSVQIFDLSGRLLMTEKADGDITLDTSLLIPGLYLLKTQDTGGTINSYRLVKE